MVPATTIVRAVTCLAAVLLGWSLLISEDLPDPAMLPIARPGGPYHGAAGVPLRLDGSASFPPHRDGSITGWVWDFGDGAPETVVLEPTILRRFPPGKHRVTLTVLDEHGRRSRPRETVCNVRESGPTDT